MQLLYSPPSDVVTTYYQAKLVYQLADACYLAGALLYLAAVFQDFEYTSCDADPTVLLPALLAPRHGGFDLFKWLRCARCCTRQRRVRWKARPAVDRR